MAQFGTFVGTEACQRRCHAGRLSVPGASVRLIGHGVHASEGVFDDNGDMLDKVASVFQIRHDPKYADGDILHQFHYMGTAPQAAVS